MGKWYIAIERRSPDRYVLAAGPYDNRSDADSDSDRVKRLAMDRWPELHFEHWGTGLFETDRPGRLNQLGIIQGLPWIVVFSWQGVRVVPNDLEHTAGQDTIDLGPQFIERSHGEYWLRVEWRQAQQFKIEPNDFPDWARARWQAVKEKESN